MKDRSYVIIKFTNNVQHNGDNAGRVKVWRDYGETWGSPIYEVIGYADSHKQAIEIAKNARDSFTYNL